MRDIRPERPTAQAQSAYTGTRAKRSSRLASALELDAGVSAASLYASASEGFLSRVDEVPSADSRMATKEIHTAHAAATPNAGAVAASTRKSSASRAMGREQLHEDQRYASTPGAASRRRQSSAPLAVGPEPHEDQRRASSPGAAEGHDALLVGARMRQAKQGHERRPRQKMQSFLHETSSSGEKRAVRPPKRTSSSGSNFYAHVIQRRTGSEDRAMISGGLLDPVTSV